MSEALQVALLVASIAFVVLAACAVPILFQARRRLEEVALAAQQSKAKLDLLADDGHELIRSVSGLAKRADQQLDDLDTVVQTVRQWAARADQLVDEVGSAIEPPVFSAVRNVNLVRAGMNGFLQALLRRNHPN